LGRKQLAVSLLAMALAGCGGGGSTEPTEAADASETTASEPTPSTPPATEETPSTPTPSEPSATAAELSAVIEEDFSKKSGAFPTGEGDTYRVTIQDGALHMFLAGQGQTNTGISLPAELPAPADTVTITADVDFQLAYGIGYGGYGLRCRAGDDYYMLMWNVGTGKRHEDAVYVVRSQGDDFDVVAEEPQPPAAVGDDGLVQMAAACATSADGSVGLSLFVGGIEVASYSDPEGLGPFDGVALFGEWKGEKIPPNDFNPTGGGLTFTIDNVVVSTD